MNNYRQLALAHPQIQVDWDAATIAYKLLSIGGVPYRQESGATGLCEVSAATHDDGLTMRTPEHGSNASHAVRLSGVAGGRAYQATGEPIGNVLWTDEINECVISIKRDDGEYINAWHALFVYTSRIAGAVGITDRGINERVFNFVIDGEDAKDSKNWQDKARGQKIGIIGLGGVGLWILDLMSKTYVRQIRIWDGDSIEGRNVVRAPGWADQSAIGQNKAEYYGKQYQRIRRGVEIRAEHLLPNSVIDAVSDLNFAFMAIDNTEVRSALCEKFEEAEIPFIDVGMGIERRNERVRGSCQVFYSGNDPGRWRKGIPTVEGAGEEEYYALQLADLGALNAALAVGAWRRHITQYEEGEAAWLIRYDIESNEILKRTES